PHAVHRHVGGRLPHARLRVAFQLLACARWHAVVQPRECVPRPLDAAAPHARVPALAVAFEPVPARPLPVPALASVVRFLRLVPALAAAVVPRGLEPGVAGRLALPALVLDVVVALHAAVALLAAVLLPYGPAPHLHVPPLREA